MFSFYFFILVPTNISFGYECNETAFELKMKLKKIMIMFLKGGCIFRKILNKREMCRSLRVL